MASQGPVLHDEYSHLSALAGYGVRRGGIDAIITDADVVAATSADDLIAIANAPPASVHDEYVGFEALVLGRSLSVGKAIGDFTDARVQAATGVENLAENTNAADETDLGHLGPRII